MCDYGSGAPVSAQEMEEAVRQALREVGEAEALYVSPSGSLLDEREVPVAALEGILRLAHEAPAKEFLCETRPQAVTESTAALLRRALPGKRISVEMGLESAEPWVLRYCINKTIELDDFQRAVQVLDSFGIASFANVLLGPPFLTEGEAIADATRSVRWAMAHGTQSCILFPSHVRRWTLVHWLWERGLYRPPSLWSLVEVVRRLGPHSAHRVGLSWYWDATDDHSILASPTTCDLCAERVQTLLHSYRATRDYALVQELDAMQCGCKGLWQARCARREAVDLVDRVLAAYEQLAWEFCGSVWWQRYSSQIVTQLIDEYAARQ